MVLLQIALLNYQMFNNEIYNFHNVANFFQCYIYLEAITNNFTISFFFMYPISYFYFKITFCKKNQNAFKILRLKFICSSYSDLFCYLILILWFKLSLSKVFLFNSWIFQIYSICFIHLSTKKNKKTTFLYFLKMYNMTKLYLGVKQVCISH